MRVFVYEWASCGGYLDRPDQPRKSLLDEGAAMLQALVEDFGRAGDVSVLTLLDDPDLVPWAMSAAERGQLFDDLASAADRTVIVAPEFDGILLRLSQRVLAAGGQLLSPVPPFIELASDKQSTAEQLNRAGVRVPKGLVLMPGERCPMGFEYPAVLKPIDGCGSLGLSLAHENMSVPRDAGAYRLETLAEGLPVSVAVLCGPAQALPLEPCRQYLEDNFSYGGGCLPLRTEHRQRAQSLALAAVKALPSTTGYVGVDLVLADAVDGSQDTVIEVNPRFTTSYVGLRAATEANLAEWCLAVSNGDRTESPSFDHAVQWDSAGNVQLGQNDALAGS